MLKVIGGTPVHVSEAAIRQDVASNFAAHGAGLRTDSDGSSAVSGGRAQIRGFLHRVAAMAHRTHGIDMPDPARLDSIAARIGTRAGYRLDEGDWTHGSVRTDAASVFSGELTDKDGMLNRPQRRKRALSEALPVRSVNAYAERYESRFVEHEGEITHYTPGTTQVGTVGARVGAKRRDIHTFVTSHMVDWLGVLQGSLTALDDAAESAYAARELFADFAEELLVKGLGDAVSLWGLADLPVARIPLTEDYSGALTMGDVFADLSRLPGLVAQINGDRGDSVDTMFLASDLARKIVPVNNLNAGGSYTARDLRMALATLFTDMGVNRIVSTPSLNGFSGSGSAGMVLARLDGQRGLHQVSAMAPAPVRSASVLLGEQTLWAMRHGGLDINDATATAIITATVGS